MAAPGRLALGGELRPLTVMATDLRDFSKVSELISAQDLTRFMNRYLSPMSEIVLAHNGDRRQICRRREHGVLERALSMPTMPAVPRAPGWRWWTRCRP